MMAGLENAREQAWKARLERFAPYATDQPGALAPADDQAALAQYPIVQ